MWVKICGITNPQTADMVAEFRPGAIGLNFYAKSPRFLDLETAKSIVSAVPESLDIVGVYVNAPVCEVATVAYQARLDFAQLHGEESPEYIAELQEALPDVKLIRAWRMGDENLDDLKAYLAACENLGVKLSACLLDARVKGMYGGSGKTVAWDVVARDYQFASWPRLILAGGLKPGNLEAAIHAVHPWGVDVASGVESKEAEKDRALVAEFVRIARSTA